MFCKNCGKQISDGLRFCPECGKETGAQLLSENDTSQQKGASSNTKKSKEERYKKHCPRCQSENITMETVVENKSRGIFKILIYLILFIIALILCIFAAPVGIVLLIILVLFAFRKKNVTITYAVCQNCGKRWKVK